MNSEMIFNTEALERLLDQLADAIEGPTYDTILMKAARRVGAKIEELMGEYPAPQQSLAFRNRRYPRINKKGEPYQSKFKTIKQQRKVFALLKDGKIPYRRTGNLGRAATTKAERVSDGIKITAGTVQGLAPYAEYVIGLPEEQALVHQDVWPSLPTTVQILAPLLGHMFLESVAEDFDNLSRRTP